MRKKWIVKIMILTALAVLYLAMGTAVYAETTGNLTESISYVLDDNGNLTISGTGEMPDYNWTSSPFYSYDDITSLKIGYGITRIGNYSFYECKNIHDVDFPESLKSIGNYAFYSNGLKNISLPDSVSKLEEYAFCNCLNAVSLKLPKTINEIPPNCFANDMTLKTLILPDSLEKIGQNAFMMCGNLREIIIPSNVKIIASAAFALCGGLEKMTFLGNAPTLEAGVFMMDTMDVYYPLKNKTWTAEIMDSGYCGKIKWIGVCSHTAGPSVTENRKEPTVFAAGSFDTVVRCKHCGQEMSRKTTTIAKLKPTVKLSAKKKTLKKKKTYTLKVTGLAKGDSVKSFKSSKKGVATVTKKGKIRAVKKGKAVITVTLKSGKTAKCKIIVK